MCLAGIHGVAVAQCSVLILPVYGCTVTCVAKRWSQSCRHPICCPPPPLQAGLIWRAIKMNVKFFNWDRALALAEQHKQHVDSVLWYRQRFLEAAKQQETNPKFMQMSEAMAIDEQHIRQKIQEERVKEAQRPGAKRYI